MELFVNNGVIVNHNTEIRQRGEQNFINCFCALRNINVLTFHEFHEARAGFISAVKVQQYGYIYKKKNLIPSFGLHF